MPDPTGYGVLNDVLALSATNVWAGCGQVQPAPGGDRSWDVLIEQYGG